MQIFVKSWDRWPLLQRLELFSRPLENSTLQHYRLERLLSLLSESDNIRVIWFATESDMSQHYMPLSVFTTRLLSSILDSTCLIVFPPPQKSRIQQIQRVWWYFHARVVYNITHYNLFHPPISTEHCVDMAWFNSNIREIGHLFHSSLIRHFGMFQDLDPGSIRANLQKRIF